MLGRVPHVSLILFHCHLEMLNDFWTRGPLFSFYTGLTQQIMQPAFLEWPSRVFSAEGVTDPLMVRDQLAKEAGQTLKINHETSYACPFWEMECQASTRYSKGSINPKRIWLIDLPVANFSDLRMTRWWCEPFIFLSSRFSLPYIYQ